MVVDVEDADVIVGARVGEGVLSNPPRHRRLHRGRGEQALVQGAQLGLREPRNQEGQATRARVRARREEGAVVVRQLVDQGPEFDLRAVSFLGDDEIAELHQLGKARQLGLALVRAVAQEAVGAPGSNAEPPAGERVSASGGGRCPRQPARARGATSWTCPPRRQQL
eukprot:9471524-Pyramimonas_sp.AAC.1